MRTRTRSSRARVLGAVAAAMTGALALSSCTFHPGQAALVNGDRISQETVTDLVAAGCDYFDSSGGASAPSTSMAFLRNLFTESLVSFRITDLAAARMGITVSPAIIAKTRADQAPELPKSMDPDDRERLDAYFDDSARNSLQVATIGAHLKDPSIKTADGVTPDTSAAGQKYLHTFSLKQKVVINPAFGSWIDGQVVDTDGSLSAAASPDARRWLKVRADSGSATDGVPASQLCG